MPQVHDRVYVSAPAINCEIVVYGFAYGDDPTELFSALRRKYPLLEGSQMQVRSPPCVGGGSSVPVVVSKMKGVFV